MGCIIRKFQRTSDISKLTGDTCTHTTDISKLTGDTCTHTTDISKLTADTCTHRWHQQAYSWYMYTHHWHQQTYSWYMYTPLTSRDIRYNHGKFCLAFPVLRLTCASFMTASKKFSLKKLREKISRRKWQISINNSRCRQLELLAHSVSKWGRGISKYEKDNLITNN